MENVKPSGNRTPAIDGAAISKDSPRLYAVSINAYFKSNKKWNNNIVEKHAEFCACENESVRRQKWRKNTAGR
jgi:hypothetical protein